MPTLPLAGIRILDFTWAQQGPVATVMLADMGAEIIKIEKRNGELGRNAGGGIGLPQPSPYFVAHSRGKKSVTLDVSRPEGHAIAMQLVARVDAVVSNMRPGVMERLGLGYQEMKAVNPRIVWAAASTYGPLGEKAELPGFDIIGQALGGIMSKTGFEGGPDMPAGAAIGDTVGALHLCAGILGGIVRAKTTGEGCQVDVSLYGTQLALQAWEIDQTSMLGRESARAGVGHPLLGGAWGAYPTSDGAIVLGGIAGPRFQQVCELIGDPELFEQYGDDRARMEHTTEIVERLRAGFVKRSKHEWVAMLEAAGIPTAAVQTYREALADPQARANGYISELPHPHYGTVTVVGSAIMYDREPTALPGPPPELGDHTEVYLEELGYSWDDIARLREAEVI
ncbi:MAG: CoA transferase [Chloroflexi bacterium]|nr:CoA transferase [Chloroflexota bacterium]MDA1003705.1 CoA transferase [Chloroflexota bacterium]